MLERSFSFGKRPSFFVMKIIEVEKLQAENDGLLEKIEEYQGILADENKVLEIIKESLLEIKEPAKTTK